MTTTGRETTPFCCLERDQYGECGHVQPGRETTCRHCGHAIREKPGGSWAHWHPDPTGGAHNRLYASCDPAKSGQPYGITAEPPPARETP